MAEQPRAADGTRVVAPEESFAKKLRRCCFELGPSAALAALGRQAGKVFLRIQRNLSAPDVEIERALDAWCSHVHPRAYDIFAGDEGIECTMRNLASSLRGGRYDLVRAAESPMCVEFTGRDLNGMVVGNDGPLVRVELRTPPPAELPYTKYLHANRVVSILFADDQRYELLQPLIQERPFPTLCGNLRCVCLSHIA